MPESRPHPREEEAPTPNPAKHRVTRKAFLAGLAGAAGAAALGRVMAADPVPTDPTKVMGRASSEVGTRSQFEAPKRHVTVAGLTPPCCSLTPLESFDGILTPNDLHFERHHNGIPEIDPTQYRLLIHGLVERPSVFTLDDLKRFPRSSSMSFLECSGNSERGYYSPPRGQTVGQIHGLINTSEWTGVPLSVLFREVGASDKATWFLAESHDGAVMARSIPTSKGWQDALIAYGQNGEALRPEQGYPARLLLPGFEGSANVKWIRRIELSDRPFMTQWETSTYSDPVLCSQEHCGLVRQFTFEMEVKSLITFPSATQVLAHRGFWEIRGLAWSGRGRIEKVEVSTDAGRSWGSAHLEEPVLPRAAVRFRFPWTWNGDETIIMSRATDEAGNVQPTRDKIISERGISTAYHFNYIQPWKVNKDGKVEQGFT